LLVVIVFCFALTCLGELLLSEPPNTDTVHTREIFSKPYLINKIYPSMTGPFSIDDLYLQEPHQRELLWIVGYETDVVGKHDPNPISQEYLCHANLDLSPALNRMQSSGDLKVNRRLFTLSQGQREIRFPKGFGIPVVSDYPLELMTQVLNLNEPEAHLGVRHRVRIHFVRDSEVEQPMTALFMLGAEVLKTPEHTDPKAQFGFLPEDAGSGPGCGLGRNADPVGDLMLDDKGQEFIGHWVVEPGREKSHTDVTRRLEIPHDLRVHYIAAHVHPTAESLELVDTTSMKQLFRAEVQNSDEGLGVETISHYSSIDGFQLKKDHRYSMVSVYDNKTDKAVDSMAVLYLYCADPEFDKESFLNSERETISSYPGAMALDYTVTEHSVDESWEARAEFGEVKEFYSGLSPWRGPIAQGDNACYWVLGEPADITLESPLEPANVLQNTGVLWVWEVEKGVTAIRYARWDK
jgi:hypothetical protein